MWDEITNPFPNFKCVVVEVWQRNFIIILHRVCDYLCILGSKLIDVFMISRKWDPLRWGLLKRRDERMQSLLLQMSWRQVIDNHHNDYGHISYDIHSSSNYRQQIGSINLTHYHIFPWLCAWDVCYIIFCYLLHIHSGKTGIWFSLLLYSLWWVKIVGYVLVCRSCSIVCTLQHLIIIIVQTYLKILKL